MTVWEQMNSDSNKKNKVTYISPVAWISSGSEISLILYSQTALAKKLLLCERKKGFQSRGVLKKIKCNLKLTLWILHLLILQHSWAWWISETQNEQCKLNPLPKKHLLKIWKKYRHITANLNFNFRPHSPGLVASWGPKRKHLWQSSFVGASLPPLFRGFLPFSPAWHSWRRTEVIA